MSKELKDSIKTINKAKEEAMEAGTWTHELMEKAIIGAGMEDSATCGVVDTIQMFIYHDDTNDEMFLREMGVSWKNYIKDAFEGSFTKEYKCISK